MDRKAGRRFFSVFGLRRFFPLFGFIVAICAGVVRGQGVDLNWAPSPSAAAAGYLLLYGVDGIHFNNVIDAGNHTNCTVMGLQAGLRFYFEVVAYDAYRDESLPSNQAECTVPNSAQSSTVQTNSEGHFALLTDGNGTVASTVGANGFVLGRKYAVKAVPGSGWVFSGWISNGTLVATSPNFAFTASANGVVQADFVVNPFPAAAGTYRGLFYMTGSASPETAGTVAVTVNSRGTYSAQIRLGSESWPLAGAFAAADGRVTRTIRRPRKASLVVALQLALGGGQLTGAVNGGYWTADLEANPDVYSKANPAPQAGKYTMVIPGSGDAAYEPGGSGFGSVVANGLGTIRISGILADGTSFTAASVISGAGQWPFYTSLYDGTGAIFGWLTVTAESGISGQLGWFKARVPKRKFYPYGFTVNTGAIGSPYQEARPGDSSGWTGGQVSLSGGNLAQTVTAGLKEVSFDNSTGMFHGRATNPETGRHESVRGIVLQDQNFGAGFFLGKNQSGGAILLPGSYSAPASPASAETP